MPVMDSVGELERRRSGVQMQENLESRPNRTESEKKRRLEVEEEALADNERMRRLVKRQASIERKMAMMEEVEKTGRMLRTQESWERMERKMMDNTEERSVRGMLQRQESVKNERKRSTVRRQESMEKITKDDEKKRSTLRRQESVKSTMVKVGESEGRRTMVRRQESMERMAKKMPPMENLGQKRASMVKRSINNQHIMFCN